MKTWALKDIKDLITAMTLKVTRYGYRTTVDVSSVDSKDLNVFFIPLENQAVFPIDMLMWLSTKFGMGKSVNYVTPPPGAQPGHAVGGIAVGITNSTNKEFAYEHKISFKIGALNVHAFVI